MPCCGVHVLKTDLEISACLCNNTVSPWMKHIIEYNVMSKPLDFLFIEMVICGSFFGHGSLVTRQTN